MSLGNDVETFKKWAVQTGLSHRDAPSNEALKTALKYRQGEIVKGMVRKVRSQQVVCKLHMIAALGTSTCLNSKTVPAVPFLKKEIQIYNDIKTLNDTVEWSMTSKVEFRNKLEKTFSLRKENLYKMHLNHKISVVKIKANIIENKTDLLHLIIHNEEQYQKRINSLMPLKANFKKSSDELTIKTMLLAKNCLKNFFSNSRILLKECSVTTEPLLYLWAHLRNIFSQIPKWTLWNAILKASGRLSREILELAQTSGSEKITFTEKCSSFDLEFLKTRTIFLNFILLCSKEERASITLSQNFITVHQQFINIFCEQLGKRNADAKYPDNISEYLEKASSYKFYNKKVYYLQQEINLRKFHLYSSKQTLKSHQLLLSKIQAFYDEISKHISKILQITVSLGQIKQKTIHTKNSYLYILNTAIYCNKKIPKRSNIDIIDSFEISEALCSTKLDFENSFGNASLRPEANIFRSKATQIMQSHKEMLIFNFWSVNRLNSFNKKCFYRLQRNDIISTTSESILVLQIRSRCKFAWLKTLDEISSLLQWNNTYHIYTVDGNTVAINIELNKEHLQKFNAVKDEDVAEILDKIKVIETTTIQKLRKLYKVYIFTLENYLCKFIPSSKLINNRPYSDYDSEIKIYNRMS